MWIIGDVHGNYKSLLDLISKLSYDQENLCFVGDLIDRGSQSAEVVQFVRENRYKCILGNHEELCLDLLNNAEYFQEWKTSIGKETYESYQKLNRNLVDDIKWFKTLPLTLLFDDLVNEAGLKLLVSHAFALSHLPIDENNTKIRKKILWSRITPVTEDIKYDTGYFNVFGHTPLDTKITINQEWANVDAGCSKKGRLAALHFPTMECIYSDVN